MHHFRLPDGRLLADGVAFASGELNYPANWLACASPDDLASHGITCETSPDSVAPVAPSDVDAERDRRMSRLLFSGVAYDFGPHARESVISAHSMALSAIIGGAQPGDLRWSSPTQDFGWIDARNTTHLMDAQTCLAFAQSGAAWRTALMVAARALKDQTPIPLDYRADAHWGAA